MAEEAIAPRTEELGKRTTLVVEKGSCLGRPGVFSYMNTLPPHLSSRIALIFPFQVRKGMLLIVPFCQAKLQSSLLMYFIFLTQTPQGRICKVLSELQTQPCGITSATRQIVFSQYRIVNRWH